MRVLVDTDILIDIALKRVPFFENSAIVIQQIESNKHVGFIAWHTLSNFYYLTFAGSGKEKAKEFIKDLLSFFHVAETNTDDAKNAVQLKVPDFEDAFKFRQAIACKADFIITRNAKNYKNSPITALTPETFLKI